MKTEEDHGFDLEQFDDPEKALALIKNLDLHNPNWTEEEILIRKMEEKPTEYLVQDGNEFTIYDEHEKTYAVLTDEEAEQEYNDHFDSDSFRDDWVEAVRGGFTDEGLKDYTQDRMDNSDRGEILNYYDGREEEEEIDGVSYFIYRR